MCLIVFQANIALIHNKKWLASNVGVIAFNANKREQMSAKVRIESWTDVK